MNILVIGSGGREHALIWALSRSESAEKIYVSPGNGGTSTLAENVALATEDAAQVIAFCKSHAVGLVVIGPEAPLVSGLSDALQVADIPVFGVSKAAAQLEGSKALTKRICKQYRIPTADYQEFTDDSKAKAYVDQRGTPIVIKADGLAAGKGVIIAKTKREAYQAIGDILVKKVFGDAGAKIVIEEFLEGEEVSFFALVDGETVVPFGSAQDHKAVGEGDTGPNTGGMGTYSPAPVMTEVLSTQVTDTIIIPLAKAMVQEGMPYRGILFAGLMLTKRGPKLLEINVRFGDPETQSLMLRLKSDLVSLLLATAKGNLAGLSVELHPHAALCVVMAAKGYPGSYKKGSIIRGLDQIAAKEDVVVFHAGTEQDKEGNVIAAGGRVLGIAARGKTVTEAQQRAYQAVDLLQWPEGFCRRDIGWRAVASEKERKAG